MPLSSGVVAAICPRICRPDAEIVAPEGGVGVGPQGRGGFGDRPRLALDLGFQLDGGIGEIVALERLVRRLRRDQAKRQRGANRCGANQTDHDGLLAADISRVTSKSARKGDGLMAAETGLRKGRMRMAVGSPNGPGRTARRGAGGWLCVRGGPQAMAHRLP